jgi:hypothetical protein
MTLATLFGAAVIVPDVITAADARALRERARFTRYSLLDRGSYEVATIETTGLHLVEIAREVTGRTLVVAEARMVRLRAGDYLLAHHDRVHADNPVELMLDLSPAPVAAEVQYRRRGQVYFRFPAVPGSLAVVERGPTVTCNHTYVSRRDAEACVVRLVLLLRELARSPDGVGP